MNKYVCVFITINIMLSGCMRTGKHLRKVIVVDSMNNPVVGVVNNPRAMWGPLYKPSNGKGEIIIPKHGTYLTKEGYKPKFIDMHDTNTTYMLSVETREDAEINQELMDWNPY
jgi:hypothetical protein